MILQDCTPSKWTADRNTEATKIYKRDLYKALSWIFAYNYWEPGVINYYYYYINFHGVLQPAGTWDRCALTRAVLFRPQSSLQVASQQHRTGDMMRHRTGSAAPT